MIVLPLEFEIALPAKKLAPALRLAPEHVARTGKSAVTNIWTDPNEYAPGTKNQTRYE
jgi:acetolactate synthase-1/2/3 large subunit